MPRVQTKRKNRAGRERTCGNCQRPILPGENYRTWSFRYGGPRFRCYRPECAPKRSDLTQSKLGEVYAAIEAAEKDIDQAAEVSDVEQAITDVAEQVEQTAEEYREADEQFGGGGATEHGERAEELDEWAGELQSFSPDEGPAEDDEEETAPEERAEALGSAKEEAQDLLNGCPV